MKKLTFILSLIFLLSLLPMLSALPTPTIQDNSHWRLTENTEPGFFSYTLNDKKQDTKFYFCSETATKVGGLKDTDIKTKEKGEKDTTVKEKIKAKELKQKDSGLDKDYICYEYVTKNKDEKVHFGKNSIIYEWINETWLIYETDVYDKEGFQVTVDDYDIYWIEKDGTTKFFWGDNDTSEFINPTINIEDFENKLTFDTENEIIHQKIEYSPFFNPATGQTEMKRTNDPLYLNIGDLIDNNNLSRDNIKITGHQYKDSFESWAFCLVELSWSGYKECLNDYKSFTIEIEGIITNTDPSLDFLFNTTTDYGLDWQTNRTEIVDLGLRSEAPVLFMDFNKNNETAGYVQDNSINNNYGTNNGATWNSSCGVTGAGNDLGGCFDFDGVNDYISIADDDSFSFGDGTKDFPVSFGGWFRMRDATTNGFISKYYGTSREWLLQSASDKVYCLFYDESIDKYIARYYNAVITGYENQWMHLYCTYDGSGSSNGINIYVNGVVKDDSSLDTGGYIAMENTLTSVEIGRWGSTEFDGQIDNVQIWDRALSADEVLNLYNGTVNNTDYIGKYANSGDFKSLVFYNSTSTFWNVTQSIADSNGSAEVYDLCNNDANCVSYWDLNGNYLDSKGTNHGTPTGTNNATGLSSGAMRFDGVDDTIAIADSAQWDMGGTMSVCVWTNIKSGTQNNALVVHDLSAYKWLLWEDLESAGVREFAFYVTTSSGASYTDTNKVYNLNTWYHVCGIYDRTLSSNRLKLYVNGNIDAQANGYDQDITAGDEGVYIGSGFNNVNGGVNGSIDEVLIYNKSLTASEITELYKAGLSQHADTNVTLQTRTADSYNISDAGLVGLWGLNGNANDELGFGNGTNHGATAGDAYGIVGQGYDFDGDNSYIDILNSDVNFDTDFSSLQEWTVGVWTKSKQLDYPSSAYIIEVWDSSNDERSWALRVDGSTDDKYDFLVSSIGNATSDVIESGVSVTEEWTQIFVTYNNVTGNFSFYVNAEHIRSEVAPISLFDGSADLWIGGLKTSLNFNGSIDEVRIYNRSLSADEIQNLYELGSYHINWNDWENSGVKEDGVSKKSISTGKFMQFKDVFTTDDTDVSAYVLNYSVTPGGELNDNPPYWLEEPTDISILDNETIMNINNVTDDNGINSCWTNVSFLGANSTNYYNITSLTYGHYSINLTCNDTLGQINSTFFNIEINSTMAIPLITNIYPTNGQTYTSLLTISNATVTFSDSGDTVWYSLDGGVTNITQDGSGGSGVYEFTSIPFVEGSNTINWWANNTEENIGEGSSTFTIDLPPVVSINTPTEGSNQNLIFPFTMTCTDTIGSDDLWYNWLGTNYTYTSTINLNGIAGAYTINAWCNDTYGSVDTTSVNFNILGAGTNVTSSTAITTCRYKKLGYYNEKLPWIKEGSCI